jgi:hypothetical protein
VKEDKEPFTSLGDWSKTVISPLGPRCYAPRSMANMKTPRQIREWFTNEALRLIGKAEGGRQVTDSLRKTIGDISLYVDYLRPLPPMMTDADFAYLPFVAYVEPDTTVVSVEFA